MHKTRVLLSGLRYNVAMITVANPDFNIQKIADSGQCFRLNPSNDGGYTLMANNRVLHLWDTENGCRFDCSQAEFDAFWRDYFDLATDYASIRAQADPEDAFLQQACAYGAGIRMLRQNPLEMLISFIISQRKNISAIKFCVEALCARYGEPIESGEGAQLAFPSANRLAELDEAHFLACSLGYRAKYVLSCARMIANGALDLDVMADLDDEALFSVLLTVPGVGEKVANCVMLFGYHRLSRFPRDVWINRVIDQEYGGAFPLERYLGAAGVLQQYIFYFARSKEYQKTLP